MPTGDSVLEKISQNVLTTLQTITTPTYAITLDVARATKVQRAPKHLNVDIFQVGPDPDDSEVVAADTWFQHYACVCYVQPGDDDTTPVDVYVNQIHAAMYHALMADVTRRGNAMNTVIMPYLPFPPINGEAGGLTFAFKVHYRTVIDDPYTAAN